MSNPTSDNKETKSRAKGPSLRIETAGDIPEERLARVAAKFAEVNEIEEYRLIIEQRDDLIGGFIVYFQGSRYDYSIKGQLSRIGSFMKQTRSFEAPVDGDVTKAAYTKEEFPSTKIKEDLGWYPETPFEVGIVKTIDWYLENEEWMNRVTSGAYQSYYAEMYKNRQ